VTVLPPERVVSRVEAIAGGLDQVTSWRRGVSIGPRQCARHSHDSCRARLVPLVSRVVQSGFLLPVNCLIEINKLDAENDPSKADLRRSLETYCAATYGRTYADGGFWRDRRRAQLTEPLHRIASASSTRYPAVALPTPRLPRLPRTTCSTRTPRDRAPPRSWRSPWPCRRASWASARIFAVLSSLAVRGGVLMRLLGLAVVDRRGRSCGGRSACAARWSRGHRH
jgi:hypothetical protein